MKLVHALNILDEWLIVQHFAKPRFDDQTGALEDRVINVQANDRLCLSHAVCPSCHYDALSLRRNHSTRRANYQLPYAAWLSLLWPPGRGTVVRDCGFQAGLPLGRHSAA